MLMSWTHPSHGLIEEPACAVHERAILMAVRTLGMGCSGEAFESMQCARCANEGKDQRTWLPSYVVDRSMPAGSGAAFPLVASLSLQVAQSDQTRGWLGRLLDRWRQA